jgi:hypothetical protein
MTWTREAKVAGKVSSSNDKIEVKRGKGAELENEDRA